MIAAPESVALMAALVYLHSVVQLKCWDGGWKVADTESFFFF